MKIEQLLSVYNPWWEKGEEALRDVPEFERPVLSAISPVPPLRYLLITHLDTGSVSKFIRFLAQGFLLTPAPTPGHSPRDREEWGTRFRRVMHLLEASRRSSRLGKARQGGVNDAKAEVP